MQSNTIEVHYCKHWCTLQYLSTVQDHTTASLEYYTKPGRLSVWWIPKYDSLQRIQTCYTFLPENGVNLLTLKASQPEIMALHLMNTFFMDHEMGTSCFVASSRSKKPALCSEMVSLIEGMYSNIVEHPVLGEGRGGGIQQILALHTYNCPSNPYLILHVHRLHGPCIWS